MALPVDGYSCSIDAVVAVDPLPPTWRLVVEQGRCYEQVSSGSLDGVHRRLASMQRSVQSVVKGVFQVSSVSRLLVNFMWFALLIPRGRCGI